MHVRILPELCVRLLKSEYYFPISILLSLIGCVRANRNIFTIDFKKALTTGVVMSQFSLTVMDFIKPTTSAAITM